MATQILDNSSLHCDPVDGRAPLVLGDDSYSVIAAKIAAPMETDAPAIWYVLLTIGLLLLGVLGVSVVYLIYMGIGIWGLNNPVAWGWAIVNFVWWVGIGHAGTLISAKIGRASCRGRGESAA